MTTFRTLLTTAAVTALMAGPGLSQEDGSGAMSDERSRSPVFTEDGMEGASGALQSMETDENADADARQTAQSAEQSDGSAGEETQTARSADHAEGESGTGSGSDTTAQVAPALAEMTVGQILGMPVRSSEGERIGEIDYVLQSGEEVEAVIGIGGLLGFNEYTVAVPLSSFEYREDELDLVLDRTREDLTEQPEFDESGAAGLPDRQEIGPLVERS